MASQTLLKSANLINGEDHSGEWTVFEKKFVNGSRCRVG